MTARSTQADPQLTDARDALKLEVEEIRDREIPAKEADDVRGAGSASTLVRGRADVGKQGC